MAAHFHCTCCFTVGLPSFLKIDLKLGATHRSQRFLSQRFLAYGLFT